MAIKLAPIDGTNAVVLEITGKLEKADYAGFVPELDGLIERHGKLRMLVEMREFSGFKLGALWEELKLGLRHHGHFERIAWVGDKQWEENMAELSKPFTSAVVKYFELADLEQARTWVLSDEPAETEAEVNAAKATPF